METCLVRFWAWTAAFVLLGLLATPLLVGAIYAFDDMIHLHLPLRWFYFQCLKRGDGFLWCPYLFCGYYLHGEGQAGMMHPLHWLAYRLLSLNAAFSLEFYFSYVWALAGMYLFLRRWELHRSAAVVGGIIFTFSGFNLLNFMHLNTVAVAAHIPWLLLGTDMILRSPRGAVMGAGCLLVSAVVASQALLGHPPALWYALLATAIYVAVVGLCALRLLRSAAAASAVALGILTGAVQLLPTLDVLGQSVRPAWGPADVLQYSLHPVRLLELAAPYLHRSQECELSVYSGAGAVVLAVLASLQWRRMGGLRRLCTWAWALALVGVWLALGRYGYLHRLLFHVPVIGMFRCPCRYMLFVQLALAVLAAVGLDQLLRPAPPDAKPTAVGALIGPLCLGLAAAAMGPFLDAHPAARVQDAVSVDIGYAPFLGALLVVGATLLVWAASRRRSRLIVMALISFVAIDHGLYGGRILWAYVSSYENLIEDVTANPLRGRRVCAVQQTDVLLLNGAYLADGFTALPPKRSGYGPAWMRLAGVGWVVDRGAVPAWLRERHKTIPIAWFLPGALARARMITKATLSREPEKDTETADVEQTALLAVALEFPGGAPGTAEILTDRPGRIVVRTRCDSRQLLVLSERYHSGWRAECDGTPLQIVPAYGTFMAVVTPQGEHDVACTFDPSSFRNGLRLSFVGLGLFVGLGAVVASAFRLRRIGISHMPVPPRTAGHET